MRITDFDIYKDLLREKSGLMITPDQTYLLESRLGPIAKKWGYPSIDGLTLALKAVPEKALISDVIEAMANHETAFFRDFGPFDVFAQKALPYLAHARAPKKKLRIWSAACASGQEAYSIAMLLKNEAAPLSAWKLDVLGTDISNEVLDQAKLGVYSQIDIQRGLSIRSVIKYFHQDHQQWTIKDDLRKLVTFKNFNLLDEMSAHGVFDAIFCRYVLAAFDRDIAENVLKRLVKQLADDGFLFLGGAEVAMNLEIEGFVPMPGTRSIFVPAASPYLKIA